MQYTTRACSHYGGPYTAWGQGFPTRYITTTDCVSLSIECCWRGSHVFRLVPHEDILELLSRLLLLVQTLNLMNPYSKIDDENGDRGGDDDGRGHDCKYQCEHACGRLCACYFGMIAMMFPRYGCHSDQTLAMMLIIVVILKDCMSRLRIGSHRALQRRLSPASTTLNSTQNPTPEAPKLLKLMAAPQNPYASRKVLRQRALLLLSHLRQLAPSVMSLGLGAGFGAFRMFTWF